MLADILGGVQILTSARLVVKDVIEAVRWVNRKLTELGFTGEDKLNALLFGVGGAAVTTIVVLPPVIVGLVVYGLIYGF